jgi:hypothetical protein
MAVIIHITGVFGTSWSYSPFAKDYPERHLKENRSSPFLLRSYSNLGTLIATIFRAGSRSKSLLLFKNSKEQLRSHDIVIANRFRKGVSCIPSRGAQQYDPQK